MKTLILNGHLIRAPGEVVQRGFVAIDARNVSELGPGDPAPELLESADVVIEASGCAVMPGFVNAHTHLFQVLLKGLGCGLTLEEWGESVIFPALEQLTADDLFAAAQLGAVENLKAGVTTLVENQYAAGSVDVARALSESGIRACIAHGAMDLLASTPPPGSALHFESAAEYLDSVDELSAAWHDHDGGRIRVAYGIQGSWLISDELAAGIARACAGNDRAIHVHCAETHPGDEATIALHGVRELGFLDAMGLVGPQTQLVHGVWLTPAEIDRVAETDAQLVHCPVSNGYLGAGIAPIRALVDAGVSIALASDGPASNNRHDLFEGMKFGALLQRALHEAPSLCSPWEMLTMAWAGTRCAWPPELGLGTLAAGHTADLIVVGLDRAHHHALHDVATSLVFNGISTDVRHVFVAGNLVVKDGETTQVDERDLVRRIQQKRAKFGLVPAA
jgi:5-methylthioadenosine/S-adenosylhomocysteine deaminase